MEFNSLQNQEEACKNYILSQAFNGWEHYKTYTDGGISGGTMKRPGLINMMDDIKDGLIQNVVVYKIDRLSRSIIDFHKMMQVFEEYNSNFVSITQAFDTSTSMGKLTMNMLLSFAQFEREVSSERISDKLAASKRKGFWTGGCPPLGYDVIDKKLIPNKKEALQVKLIFEKYLELGSIRKLRDHLFEIGIKGKKWTTNKGTTLGGGILTHSMLSKLLRAKIYIGRIENKKEKKSYPGRHKAIIEKKLFDKVQALIKSNRNNLRETYCIDSNLLSNKITDADGNIFKNQKSSKKYTRKYRYYALKGKYIPAGEIEDITFQVIRSLLNSPPHQFLNDSQVRGFKSIDFDNLTPEEQKQLVRSMITKIIYHRSRLIYFIKVDDLSYLKNIKKKDYVNVEENTPFGSKVCMSIDKSHLIIEADIHINNRPFSNRYIGKGEKLISVSEKNNNLIKALSFAWRYGKMYWDGMSLRTIGAREHKSDRTVYKYINLNYLSPNIVNNIMGSNVPSHVNLQTLFSIASKHHDFQDQERVFYNSEP